MNQMRMIIERELKKTQINYTSTINETQDAHQMTLNK